jgi:hypothetical protein
MKKNHKLTIAERMKIRLLRIAERALAWIPSGNYRQTDYPVFHVLRLACLWISNVWVRYIVPVLKVLGFVLFEFVAFFGVRFVFQVLSKLIH